MKKQRKNTVSRDAVAKELPREERKESSGRKEKKPWEFEKKERPGRKPRRDKKESDFKSSDRKATRAPRQKDANGKPLRRNTRSRDEAGATERRDGGNRKPRFEKKDSDRKPLAEKRDYKSGDRKSSSKPATGGGKDYFKSFAEGNRKKRKEDFKIKKEDLDKAPISNRRKDEFKENRTNTGKRSFKEKFVKPEKRFTEKELVEEQMPLNKFISRAGICSRREAAELIKAGEVKVNGEVHKEPGYKVLENDIVTYQGNDVTKQEKSVYFLLNKAKDYITTTDDPEGRKTVMDLFKDVKERIFPVGRLDRNTTGLLLLTNDGHLAQRLSHPKYQNKKVYQVKLDKALTEDHFEKIVQGLELEDGKAAVDSLAYTNPENKKEVGIEIHIGKNRIVRRIFESLDYEVKHLDRVMYAGLTKKNLPRGKWRALNEKELVFLKHFK